MTSLESVRLRDRSSSATNGGTPESSRRMAVAAASTSPAAPSSLGGPRTPKSVGGDRTRMLRRELFSPVSPGWRSCVGSPGSLVAGKSPKKTRPISDHFKMQMPTSARKKPVEPGPPSARFSPIVKSTFYGSASPVLSDSKKSIDPDESMNSVDSDDDENQLNSSADSKKDDDRRQPLKPKNSKDDPLRSKKSIQSGRVGKTKVKPAKKKKSVLGGKGVSHAIKKPSKKMIAKRLKQREDRLKRERVAKMKESRKEASRSIIKSATAEFGKSFFEDLVDDDKASNRKARRSHGKISIPRPNANVSYEIKNGVPVFSLRRSPRKQQYLSPETPAVISRSTPKLFSPNGTDDYLMTGGNSPARGKRSRPVPSPIKFDPAPSAPGADSSQNTDDTDDRINDSVKNIISALDTEEEEETGAAADGGNDMSQDEHAFYVTEDEMDAMAVALDAANAATADAASAAPAHQPKEDSIQDILSSMSVQTPRKGTPAKGTPRKIAKGTPVKAKDTPVKGTPTKGTPARGTPSKGTPAKGTPAKGTPAKPAKGTPAKGTPSRGTPAKGTPAKPAKGTPARGTPAKGTPAKGTPLKGRQTRGTPVKTAVTGTPKRETPARGTPKKSTPAQQKNFPIFERRLTRSGSTPQSNKGKGNTPRSREPGVSCSTTEADRDGKKQMVIDAGQKVIGAQHCVTCDFVYTSGDVDEERLHQAKHNQTVGLVKFAGTWRNETCVEAHDGRVVVVAPGDPRRHWDKVDAVLDVVDILLGTSSGQQSSNINKIRNPEQTKAFMFVTEGRVVGMLLAECLDKTDRVSMSVLKNKETGLRLLEDDLPKATRSKVVAGVAKIWVAAEYQRRKIATRLVDAMRTHFLPIKPLATDEFAFSHTTPNGSEFAANYLTRTDFLTYAPTLPGQKGH